MKKGHVPKNDTKQWKPCGDSLCIIIGKGILLSCTDYLLCTCMLWICTALMMLFLEVTLISTYFALVSHESALVILTHKCAFLWKYFNLHFADFYVLGVAFLIIFFKWMFRKNFVTQMSKQGYYPSFTSAKKIIFKLCIL